MKSKEQNKHWSQISAGSTIEIVAPASAVTKDVLLRSVQYLEKKGFKVRLAKGTLEPYLFHASPDEQRFALLKSALHSDADALWAIRGGYGSNRLLPMLSKLKRPKKTKLFIGISDVTSLHLFLNEKWQWPTLHASLLDRLAEGRLPASEEQETFAVLAGKIKEIEFPNLKALNLKAEKNKKTSGVILGGNLMTLQSAIGTPYQVDFKNKILFLEEIDERGYRIDRMLTHLVQAGSLKGIKAILFGHFIGGQEPGGQTSKVWDAINRFALENKNIPMWSGVESGHDLKLRPLPMGTISLIHGNDLFVQTGAL